MDGQDGPRTVLEMIMEIEMEIFNSQFFIRIYFMKCVSYRYNLRQLAYIIDFKKIHLSIGSVRQCTSETFITPFMKTIGSI